MGHAMMTMINHHRFFHSEAKLLFKLTMYSISRDYLFICFKIIYNICSN